MLSCMVQAVCVIVKSFSASIRANEWLFSSMNPLMDVQIRLVLKNFPAARVRALMRRLPVVCPHMILELSLMRKHPLTTTMWAREGSTFLELFLFYWRYWLVESFSCVTCSFMTDHILLTTIRLFLTKACSLIDTALLDMDTCFTMTLVWIKVMMVLLWHLEWAVDSARFILDF